MVQVSKDKIIVDAWKNFHIEFDIEPILNLVYKDCFMANIGLKDQ